VAVEGATRPDTVPWRRTLRSDLYTLAHLRLPRTQFYELAESEGDASSLAEADAERKQLREGIRAVQRGDDPTGVIHGKTVTNPLYNSRQLYAHDVSIILLDNPVTNVAPAKIAPIGLLSQMKADRSIYSTVFTNVGYGTHEQVAVPKVGPTYPFTGDREFSFSSFNALDPKFIHLSQNLAQGWGGTGYGDSGGPTFIDTANGPVQISTVSTGDVPLYATSVNTRLDTKEAHDFLAPYLD